MTTTIHKDSIKFVLPGKKKNELTKLADILNEQIEIWDNRSGLKNELKNLRKEKKVEWEF